jgi:hypothetical protein
VLTFETETHQATHETLVFVKSSRGGNERALLAAFNSPEAAAEFAQFLQDAAHVRGYGPPIGRV